MSEYDLTIHNINSVRSQIAQKLNYNTPFYATQNCVSGVLTDFDHFPYKRSFRGVYYEQAPVVLEREAGFRPRRDACYTQNSIPVHIQHNYCWEYPCSTVKPCKAKETSKEEKNGNQKMCQNNFNISP